MIVRSFKIVEEWSQPHEGYIRVRVMLTNGDFLELAEYFAVAGDACVTQRYRYQWMNGERTQLRRRWDNVEHYPLLPNFPHHVHFPDGRVEPGRRLSILELLSLLKKELV